MSMVLPILFNTEMVRTILDGRKTVTRRIVKRSVWENFVCEGGKVVNWIDKKTDILESPVYKAPCQAGDILYVRETWFQYCGEYIYRAGAAQPGLWDGMWRPSIHMPKEAARIWLKVTDVRVERLQEIDGYGILAEGIDNGKSNPANGKRWENMQRMAFSELWNSTIKKIDHDHYGWDVNPWVWVIEFERCGKQEEG